MTLEDIVEEILGVEIEDEYDIEGVDVQYTAKVQRTREVSKYRNLDVVDSSLDFARLALLRPQLNTETLTPEEISVVTSYLTTEISQVRQFFHQDAVKIRELVSKASVMTLTRRSKTPSKPEQEDILIHQGKLLTTFFLLLNGKITVLVGKDQFHVEKGSWTVLGADVLTMPERTYLPDFTAFITSEQARVIIFKPFNHEIVQYSFDETKEQHHN